MDHPHISLVDNGGYLMPGLDTVANFTGRPEPILTSSQWDTLRTAASRGPGDFDFRVYIGETELTDIVKVEIVALDRELESALTTRGA